MKDPISNIIEKYKNHPSIIGIKNTFPSHSFAIETVRKYTNQKSLVTIIHKMW